MNSKIFVFVAIIGLAAALGVILLSGSSFVSHTSEDITKEIPQAPQQIQPISVELADISIIEAGKRDATIEITFKLSNPNPSSILVQVMDYQLFETGYSNEKQISFSTHPQHPKILIKKMGRGIKNHQKFIV